MLKMKTQDLDERIRKHFPGHMPMGLGMAEMMEMGRPKNIVGSSFEDPLPSAGHCGGSGLPRADAAVIRRLARTTAAAVLVTMLAIWSAASGATAQTSQTEDHEKHHPPGVPAPSQTPAPPGPAAKRTPAHPVVPTPGMGMEMMKEMERMMGAPPKKPLVGRLLEIERLSKTERDSLRADPVSVRAKKAKQRRITS